MLKYILYRLVASVPVLIGVSLAVFFMLRLVPGDPVQLMFVGQAQPSPERIQEMRHQLGLDLPIYQQYIQYMGDLLQGDLGNSIRSRQPVAPQIVERLPNTLKLATAGLAFAMVIGLTTGILSATFRGTWIDRISMVVAVAGISIPGFWLGMMIMLLFGVRLGWFPVSGAESWRQLVMPAATLGITASAVLTRLTRASMLEALNQDYV